MFKKILLLLIMLLSIAFPCFAKEWVFYGTSDSGQQLFYNSSMIDFGYDSKDKKDVTMVWIGAQDPKKKFVDTLFYVGLKENPQEFAYLGEVHCTREGKITKQKTYKNPKWESTKEANLMAYLYQQIEPIAKAKKEAEKKKAEVKANQGIDDFNVAGNPTVAETPKPNPAPAKPAASVTASYVGNARTMKFHWPSCRWAKKISAGNRVGFSSREEAVESGYVPCQVCRP
jgi:hypothetical protein